jgi:TonB family protein
MKIVAFAAMLAGFLTLCAGPTGAQTLQSNSQVRPIKYVPPKYPTVAQNSALEGWAEFEFTVSTDGRPIDIRSVDLSSPIFEENSIAALQQIRYQPAIVNGVPVERAGVRFRFTYVMSAESLNYARGVTENRASAFRMLIGANERKDEKEVTRLLERLSQSRSLSLFEHAVLAHISADQLIRREDGKAALEALQRIPWDTQSITDSMRERAWAMISSLAAYEGRWGLATYTFGQLKLIGKEDLVPASFRKALEERESRYRGINPERWSVREFEGRMEEPCEPAQAFCRYRATVWTGTGLQAIEVLSDPSDLRQLYFDCKSRNTRLSANRRALYLAPLPQEECTLWVSGDQGARYDLKLSLSE